VNRVLNRITKLYKKLYKPFRKMALTLLGCGKNMVSLRSERYMSFTVSYLFIVLCMQLPLVSSVKL
jgi:hypothetical protein